MCRVKMSADECVKMRGSVSVCMLVLLVFSLLALVSIAMSSRPCSEDALLQGLCTAGDGGSVPGQQPATTDTAGFDAIRSLHLQLDDDANGQIDKAESDEFLREELNYASGHYGSRLAAFHESDRDQEEGGVHRGAVSVGELWEHWRRSLVHNWTVEETADWLVAHVHLPQYRQAFIAKQISGRALPRMAVNNNHYLSGVLGIRDPRHKQKLMLKAMDAVLFGPPKDAGNWVKDVLLVTLLTASMLGGWLVYRQNAKFQMRMRKMTADMESLSTAETTLLELQRELDRANEEKEAVSSQKRRLEQRLTTGDSGASSDGHMELERLRSEVEILTEALRCTEAELEGRSWSCPPALQHWLQLTHELELRAHSAKRQRAEQQLENAKVMGEKLRKKQASLYGALVSMHGRAVNDVDASIIDARRALLEVTRELQERSYRWRQIELICGFSVVHNPGLPYLESVTRSMQHAAAHSGMSRVASSSLARMEDSLDDDDSASTVMSRQSAISELVSRSTLLLLSSGSGVLPAAARRPPSPSSAVPPSRSAAGLRNGRPPLRRSDTTPETFCFAGTPTSAAVACLERPRSSSSLQQLVGDRELQQQVAEQGEQLAVIRSGSNASVANDSVSPAVATSTGSWRPLSACQDRASPPVIAARRAAHMVKSHSHDEAASLMAAVAAAGPANGCSDGPRQPISRSDGALDTTAAASAVQAQLLGARLKQLASAAAAPVDEDDELAAGEDDSMDESSGGAAAGATKSKRKFQLFRRQKAKAM